MTSELYTAGFFREHLADSYPSAQRIVPAILDLIRAKSVVDIGCGLGHFLKVFAEHGVPTILGVDGDWVPPDKLVISPDCFARHDLGGSLLLGRRFDLVVSLEVAEHLAPEAADRFVACLVAHGPVVVFSAAIPSQGGRGHVNEQWLSYWVAKFAAHGFRALDLLRPLLWTDSAIACWYRQNVIIFSGDEGLAANPKLAERAASAAPPLDLVHPDLYAYLLGMAASEKEKSDALTKYLSAGGLFLVDTKPDGSLNIEKA